MSEQFGASNFGAHWMAWQHDAGIQSLSCEHCGPVFWINTTTAITASIKIITKIYGLIDFIED